MKSAKRHIGFACVLFLLVGVCLVTGGHTADARLLEKFATHEVEFERLLAEVRADGGLEMLRGGAVRYAGHIFSGQDSLQEAEVLGLPRSRWLRYQQQFRALGIAQIIKTDRTVEFRVDEGTISNGDSYKGYEYSAVPPLGHERKSLDRYRPANEDRDEFGNFSVYKPIKGNWYLYLFVNR